MYWFWNNSHMQPVNPIHTVHFQSKGRKKSEEIFLTLMAVKYNLKRQICSHSTVLSVLESRRTPSCYMTLTRSNFKTLMPFPPSQSILFLRFCECNCIESRAIRQYSIFPSANSTLVQLLLLQNWRTLSLWGQKFWWISYLESLNLWTTSHSCYYGKNYYDPFSYTGYSWHHLQHCTYIYGV